MMRWMAMPGVQPAGRPTVWIFSTVLLAACAQQPTPYQPLGPEGGYQETRLQERVYRVTFQGNPATRAGTVLDLALRRCAELAQQAGYAAFVLLGRSSEAKLETAVRSLPEETMFPGRSGFFGLPRYETVTYVRYHEVTLLMRMLTAEEAAREKDAFDAADLLRRLETPRQPQTSR